MSAVAGKRVMTDATHYAGAGVAPADHAHALELTVWDVPSAVGAGERFAVAVGARCPAGCNLGGKALTFFDHRGAPVATVELGSAVWPGTEALYGALAEARAPLEIGSHQWAAKMAGWAGELPHAAAEFSVAVRVVAAPDCEVTVNVIDRESHAPIAGARVVIHPYRAVTDRNGMARVQVGRGQYDVVVSGKRYLPSCIAIEATTDVTITAELDADRPDEEAYE